MDNDSNGKDVTTKSSTEKGSLLKGKHTKDPNMDILTNQMEKIIILMKSQAEEIKYLKQKVETSDNTKSKETSDKTKSQAISDDTKSTKTSDNTKSKATSDDTSNRDSDSDSDSNRGSDRDSESDSDSNTKVTKKKKKKKKSKKLSTINKALSQVKLIKLTDDLPAIEYNVFINNIETYLMNHNLSDILNPEWKTKTKSQDRGKVCSIYQTAVGTNSQFHVAWDHKNKKPQNPVYESIEKIRKHYNRAKRIALTNLAAKVENLDFSPQRFSNSLDQLEMLHVKRVNLGNDKTAMLYNDLNLLLRKVSSANILEVLNNINDKLTSGEDVSFDDLMEKVREKEAINYQMYTNRRQTRDQPRRQYSTQVESIGFFSEHKCETCQATNHNKWNCNEKPQCSRCKKEGHFYYRCPEARCNKCNSMGHMMKVCPEIVCNKCQ